jgi:hypothetical protein
VTVTARLAGGPPESVNIVIRDLTAMVSENGQAMLAPPNHWKFYATAGNQAFVKASTLPDNDECRGRLGWTNNCKPTAAGLAYRVVDVSRAGDVTVTATLLTKSRSVTLHVCDWPLLAPQTVTFSNGHTVDNDTVANFDNEWREGRGQNVQSPLCYTRNTAIRMAAVLKVVRQPTEAETINIRATARLGLKTLTWTANNVNVAPGPLTVNFPASNSSDTIPDEVNFYDPMTVKWEMTTPNGTFESIGETKNSLYATLRAPNGTPPYWTLLDYSCRAASGLSSADTVAAALIAPFATRQIQRKRDAKPLTYWKPETNTAGTTQALLASPVGNGHCGSWAEMLIDMYKVHGITTGTKVWVGPPSYHTDKCLRVYGISTMGAAAVAAGTAPTVAVQTDALEAARRSLGAINAAGANAAQVEADAARIAALGAKLSLPVAPVGTLDGHFINLRQALNRTRMAALNAPALGTDALKATEADNAIIDARLASIYQARAAADGAATNDTKAAAAAMAAAAWAYATVVVKVAFSTTLGFLVRGWTFEHPPASNANALTHEMAPTGAILGFLSRLADGYCRCTNPIPGQQNTSPPPKFLNHWIVRYDPTGDFYDPSYGVGPCPNRGTWELAAVDGLWNNDQAGFDATLRPNPPGLVEFYDDNLMLLP